MFGRLKSRDEKFFELLEQYAQCRCDCGDKKIAKNVGSVLAGGG